VLVTYGDYGIGLPRVLWRIVRLYPSPALLAFSGALALLVFFYLYRMPGSSEVQPPKGSGALILIVGGLAVSGLTYGYPYGIGYKGTAEIDNRVVVAAAVGVACSLVGWLGWSSSFLGRRDSRTRVFYILIALVCGIGFLINNIIATFWIEASRQQHTILADIRQHFPSFPSRTTLLLDGYCPYIGPGIVFETYWDVSGVLQIIYRDRTLKGDVVKPNTQVEDDGISTFMYDVKSIYPYRDLLVYNVSQKASYQLTDAETARTNLAGFKTDFRNGCAKGRGGFEPRSL
jgi:hypothetical protein